MKTTIKILLAGTLFLINFNNNDAVNYNLQNKKRANFFQHMHSTKYASFQKALLTEKISKKDLENIIYMLEEEKLANNVYVFLNEKFNQRIFNNISRSEERHQQAIKWLIETYEIDVPNEKPFGKFNNKALQKMYNELTENATTLEDALKAGAYIEEHDIKDLKIAISETQNADIKRVFSNLLRASNQHLRAFTARLRFMNVAYEPQILSKEEYKTIITKK